MKRLSKTKYLLLALLLLTLSVFLVYQSGVFRQNKTSDPYQTALNKSEENHALDSINGKIKFIRSSGEVLSKINIELANTPQKIERGLMFRKSMPENQGMLFILSFEKEQSFWMKNTVIPLDIIFVNSHKVIVKIHKNTVPFSETPLRSGNPAIYAIEVNAGYTDRYGIREGDIIGVY